VPTGYEVGLYRDVERVRNAVERLANIETCRYLRERLRDGGFGPGEKDKVETQLATYEGRVSGGSR
jgi:hypothetical protein